MTTEELFNELVREHSRKLYAHIRSMVLDHEHTNDILQNTFMKAWQSFSQFRGEAKPSTWLFRIATNEALQHLRRQKARKWLGMNLMQTSNKAPEIQHPDGDQIRQKLEAALHTLTTQQRMIFSMRYFNEMKYSEMSEILNLAEGTLKATYHQASRKIELKVKELIIE